ncbi:MAG: hypothetical protein R3C15_19930 [Thermoleophilia bacterium]
MREERRPPDEGLDDPDLLDPRDDELDGLNDLPDPEVDELAEVDEDAPELDERSPWAE